MQEMELVKTDHISDYVRESLSSHWSLDDHTDYLAGVFVNAIKPPKELAEKICLFMRMDNVNDAIDSIRELFKARTSASQQYIEAKVTGKARYIVAEIEFVNNLLQYFVDFYDTETERLIIVDYFNRLTDWQATDEVRLRVYGTPSTIISKDGTVYSLEQDQRSMYFREYLNLDDRNKEYEIQINQFTAEVVVMTPIVESLPLPELDRLTLNMISDLNLFKFQKVVK